MVKIEESSGFLTLRNFCITVDYELLENIEEIILRNIDITSPYNRYKIQLKPNEKTIVKNYEFSTIKAFKEELNKIHNINNFDIEIELRTKDINIEITFNKEPEYNILHVRGSNVDLAYGKYYQLVNVLKRKRTFYWLLVKPYSRVVTLISFCLFIGYIVDYCKIPEPILVWSGITILYMWLYSISIDKICPARVLKLNNRIPWYQNQTLLTLFGLITSIIIPIICALLNH